MSEALTLTYQVRNCIGDESRRWKNVTLKIMGSEEELTLPMMQASTVYDVKAMLAEVISEDPNKIDLYDKIGCKFKRMRNSEEIATKVLVKGVKHFARKMDEYPHQFIVVGGGHLGIRQAMHWMRNGQDWTLFERKAKIGGNAWNGIANRWSKLQSEGPHYHLTWDSVDGREQIMMPYNKYSFWPTRDEILAHFHDIVTQFNLWPNMKMGTQVMDMEIIPQPHGTHENFKTYRIKHQNVGKRFNKDNDAITDALDNVSGFGEEGYLNCSCMSFYPGALAAPHRKTFPGEDVFGGQIGYGFNDEFDYALVHQQDGIVIGMGAFAVENVRTLMEHAARKFYVIARHHNLLLPRILSWYVNQSQMPPPAAVILQAMEPAYKLYGTDPWSYFSVTSTADRSHASIKQYTRWGIGDIFFLGVYYGKIETVEGEVKRLKKRTAVINNGRVIEDLDHMIKVLGFDGDFGVDRIMHVKVHVGFWPDADYRRWVCSDQSAIDASRFGGTAIAPYAAACTHWPHHFFKYTADAKRVISMGVLSENKAKPELGSPAYHYEPRIAATVQVTYGSVIPEIAEFSGVNDAFKKDSMWSVAPIEKFHEECEKDWFRYCEKFKEFGSTVEPPPYPYTMEYCYWLMKLESQDTFKMAIRQGQMNNEGMEYQLSQIQAYYDEKVRVYEERRGKRMYIEQLRREAIAKGEEPPPELEPENVYGHLAGAEHASYEKPADRVNAEEGTLANLGDKRTLVSDTIKNRSQMMVHQETGALKPGAIESFEPAKTVLRLRGRAPTYGRSPSPTQRRINEEWLTHANQMKEAILLNAKNNAS